MPHRYLLFSRQEPIATDNALHAEKRYTLNLRYPAAREP